MIVFQIIVHCNEGQNTIAYGKALFVDLPLAKTTIKKKTPTTKNSDFFIQYGEIFWFSF